MYWTLKGQQIGSTDTVARVFGKTSFSFKIKSLVNLNFQTRNSLFLKMLVKWGWSNSSCFSQSSDGGECFIYPAMPRIHADLWKLIKNPSLAARFGQQCFSVAFCTRLKTSDNQRYCQISNEVFRVNSISCTIQSALGWLLFLVQQEPGESWRLNSFHWTLLTVQLLAIAPHPAQTPTMFPATGECWPRCHGCTLDKKVLCYVQAEKHGIPNS